MLSYDQVLQIRNIALAHVLEPTVESEYRKLCRWYSKTFHTPLHIVMALSPQDVYMAFFEETFESQEDEKLTVEALKALDPNYDANEEEKLQDFIAKIEAEETLKKSKKNKAKQSSIDKDQIASKTVSKTYNLDEAIDHVGDSNSKNLNDLEDLEGIVNIDEDDIT